MLSVALPKGRLGEEVLKLFSKIGLDCDFEKNRKLVLENPGQEIRYFLVKPADVAIYVEQGAADLGVLGKDTLLESQASVYELMDLGLGRCRVAVAGPADYRDDRSQKLRVATKYPNIAKAYYATQYREIEIIKLNGSIELAPILGLSDVILDIVETGATLRENNLRVLTDVMPISARLIANKSGYQFQKERVDGIVDGLLKIVMPERGGPEKAAGGVGQ